MSSGASAPIAVKVETTAAVVNERLAGAELQCELLAALHGGVRSHKVCRQSQKVGGSDDPVNPDVFGQ